MVAQTMLQMGQSSTCPCRHFSGRPSQALPRSARYAILLHNICHNISIKSASSIAGDSSVANLGKLHAEQNVAQCRTFVVRAEENGSVAVAESKVPPLLRPPPRLWGPCTACQIATTRWLDSIIVMCRHLSTVVRRLTGSHRHCLVAAPFQAQRHLERCAPLLTCPPLFPHISLRGSTGSGRQRSLLDPASARCPLVSEATFGRDGCTGQPLL